jgi:hypothetical protein
MLYREKSGNSARVARLFFIQHTKTGENIPNNHKISKMATKYLYQMTVKYVDQMAIK